MNAVVNSMKPLMHVSNKITKLQKELQKEIFLRLSPCPISSELQKAQPYSVAKLWAYISYW